MRLVDLQEMGGRLRAERKATRSLIRLASTNPEFGASRGFAAQLAARDELFGFVVNWVADGRPSELCRRFGYRWEHLCQGTPLQRLSLRLQFLNLLLTEFEFGTPLHAAASHGHLEIVVLLIAAGADTEARDPQGKTPIEVACKPEIAELLRVGR